MRRRFFLLATGLLLVVLAVENLIFREFLPEYLFFGSLCGGFLADLFWPAVFCALMLFFRSRIAAVLTCASLFAFTFLKLVNLVLFYRMRAVLTYSTWRILAAHTDMESIRIQFAGGWIPLLLAFFFSAGVFFALYSVSAVRYARRREHPVFANKLKLAVLCLIPVSACANLWYTGNSETLGKGYFPKEFPVRPAMVFYSDFLRDRAIFLAEESEARANAETDTRPCKISQGSRAFLTQCGVELSPKHLPRGTAKPFRQIVLIAVESLDAAFLACRNPAMPRTVTPFLDACSRQYPSMKNYFTASQPTSWGLLAMLRSRFDYERELAFRPARQSLCDVFTEHGYDTLYFSPVTRMFYNQGASYGKLFHFRETYYLEDLHERFDVRGSNYWGIGDAELFDCAARVLEEKQNTPFFCFISTIDLHPPYSLSGPALGHSFGNPFLDSLASVDANLERFVERLKRMPWFGPDSLILITADHSATHGANYTNRRAFNPDRIPLIWIAGNGKCPPGLDTDTFCSQIDLPTTLLELSGWAVPAEFIGSSMLRTKKFAWSKSPSSIILHLPDRDFTYNLEAGPAKNEAERALLEWYRSVDR